MAVFSFAIICLPPAHLTGATLLSLRSCNTCDSMHRPIMQVHTAGNNVIHRDHHVMTDGRAGVKLHRDLGGWRAVRPAVQHDGIRRYLQRSCRRGHGYTTLWCGFFVGLARGLRLERRTVERKRLSAWKEAKGERGSDNRMVSIGGWATREYKHDCSDGPQ